MRISKAQANTRIGTNTNIIFSTIFFLLLQFLVGSIKKHRRNQLYILLLYILCVGTSNAIGMNTRNR